MDQVLHISLENQLVGICSRCDGGRINNGDDGLAASKVCPRNSVRQYQFNIEEKLFATDTCMLATETGGAEASRKCDAILHQTIALASISKVRRQAFMEIALSIHKHFTVERLYTEHYNLHLLISIVLRPHSAGTTDRVESRIDMRDGEVITEALVPSTSDGTSLHTKRA